MVGVGAKLDWTLGVEACSGRAILALEYAGSEAEPDELFAALGISS